MQSSFEGCFKGEFNMITKISGFTHKSFNNYTGPSDTFREKNIVFGYNGSGKSSLVTGIKNSFLDGQGNTDENIRIYSSDYISNYLLLDPSNRRNIKGVKAIFGEKNVEIETEIKELEEKTISDSEIIRLKTEINKLENDAITEINNIFDSKKGALRIQRKSSSLSLLETINAYQDDLNKALKIEANLSRIASTIGDDSIEERIVALELLNNVPEISNRIINYEEISKIQAQEYDDIKIPNSTIIRWLSEGVPIHQGKTHCEFCGSQIDLDIIRNKVEDFKNNVKFSAEKFYYELYKYLQEKIDSTKNILQKKELYTVQDNNFGMMFINLEKTLDSIIKINLTFKYNSDDVISLQKIDISDLKNTITKFSDIGSQINELLDAKISKEKVKLDKIGTLVKGAVSIAISKSTLINGNIGKIDTNKALLADYEKSNEIYFSKIKKLKISKTVTADFMMLVNDILQDINLSIRLKIEGNDYYLETTLLNNDELTVDDISEGEKNLLSLIFFYFEMFDDKAQKELKHEIKLIILDDPISSMDDSNRFYVLEMVSNILDLNVEQVFVLSHVWDDYCQLTYNRNCFHADSKFASFEIIKNHQSEVVRNMSKGNPYKFMFKEIFDLSQKHTLSTDCDYFHIPNTLRKVFEEFLFFKTNKNMLAQNSHKKEIESKFNITSMRDKTKLGTLLKVANVLSHTNTKTNDDILTSAKFLMKLIKNNDKLHYDAMKQ
jgi:ABC-type multidrug transport system ATPase subunit